jgi:hypothetical protein
MDPTTFGDPDRIRSLIGIAAMIGKIEDPYKRRYVSHFLHKFNEMCKDMKVEWNKDYIYMLILDDYMNRIDLYLTVCGDYDKDLISHIENYVKTKLRITLGIGKVR